MGYSPKHAKPVSLRGTALRTPLTGGAATGPGRHRAGARVPGPRVPGDESVPADPVTDSAGQTAEEAVPAERRPAGHSEEKMAAGAPSGDQSSGERQAARAEALMKLIPLQRSPLPES